MMKTKRLTLIHTSGTMISVFTEPTADLIRSKAKSQAKDIQVTARLCEGAFQAGISGDAATHDRIVASGLTDLIDHVDVVVLAQASMARVKVALDAVRAQV